MPECISLGILLTRECLRVPPRACTGGGPGSSAARLEALHGQGIPPIDEWGMGRLAITRRPRGPPVWRAPRRVRRAGGPASSKKGASSRTLGYTEHLAGSRVVSSTVCAARQRGEQAGSSGISARAGDLVSWQLRMSEWGGTPRPMRRRCAGGCAGESAVASVTQAQGHRGCGATSLSRVPACNGRGKTPGRTPMVLAVIP